jgi:hypothetical protein
MPTPAYKLEVAMSFFERPKSTCSILLIRNAKVVPILEFGPKN